MCSDYDDEYGGYGDYDDLGGNDDDYNVGYSDYDYGDYNASYSEYDIEKRIEQGIQEELDRREAMNSFHTRQKDPDLPVGCVIIAAIFWLVVFAFIFGWLPW